MSSFTEADPPPLCAVAGLRALNVLSGDSGDVAEGAYMSLLCGYLLGDDEGGDEFRVNADHLHLDATLLGLREAISWWHWEAVLLFQMELSTPMAEQGKMNYANLSLEAPYLMLLRSQRRNLEILLCALTTTTLDGH